MVFRPLKVLRSWAEARFDTTDPHVAACVDIISAWVGVLIGVVSRYKGGLGSVM